jgi:hypothetical protein
LTGLDALLLQSEALINVEQIISIESPPPAETLDLLLYASLSPAKTVWEAANVLPKHSALHRFLYFMKLEATTQESSILVEPNAFISEEGTLLVIVQIEHVITKVAGWLADTTIMIEDAIDRYVVKDEVDHASLQSASNVYVRNQAV